jgi:branched-subunit amino acid transport protein
VVFILCFYASGFDSADFDRNFFLAAALCFGFVPRIYSFVIMGGEISLAKNLVSTFNYSAFNLLSAFIYQRLLGGIN